MPAGVGLWLSARSDARVEREKRDAKNELIAYGESKGLEYVPGSCIDRYRQRVKDHVERLEDAMGGRT